MTVKRLEGPENTEAEEKALMGLMKESDLLKVNHYTVLTVRTTQQQQQQQQQQQKHCLKCPDRYPSSDPLREKTFFTLKDPSKSNGFIRRSVTDTLTPGIQT
ncbi:hypothetical protein NQZ68_036483 [Dissostichus eleginoides]|nr:hypothetical protein NQZ68_036483 [Dissostichus eleginoides]